MPIGNANTHLYTNNLPHQSGHSMQTCFTTHKWFICKPLVSSWLLAPTRHSINICWMNTGQKAEKHIHLFCCVLGFTETFEYFSFECHSFILPLCLPQSIFMECLWCVRHWTTCQHEWDVDPTSLDGLEWVVLTMLVLSQATILSESPTTVGVALKWLCGRMQRRKTLTWPGACHSSWSSEQQQQQNTWTM